MDSLFKGYVITNDKKSTEKLRGRNNFKTYEQFKNLQEFYLIILF